MSKMPSSKAREILEILFKAGFEKVRTSGSHIRLVKDKNFVTVPFHPRKTLPKGTLNSIIEQSKLPKEFFLRGGKKK